MSGALIQAEQKALPFKDGGDDCVEGVEGFEGEVFFCDSFGGDRRRGVDRGSRV